MPELPEVEAICRGLKTKILNSKIITVTIRNSKLRRPIPKKLCKFLPKQVIKNISRRGKYILLETKIGTLIIHLGMSGTLQIKPKNHLINKHEHFNIVFANNLSLCYTDPRRFGAILWTTKNPLQYPTLKNLGPEPLKKNFTGNYLHQKAKSKKCAIKLFIMDNKIVTGIGNIYANEILFAAGVNPSHKVHTIPIIQYHKIVEETKKILSLAIICRGTTIKDHTDSTGQKGSFQNKLKVYGKHNQPCSKCKTKLVAVKIGQRATVFCPRCQK